MQAVKRAIGGLEDPELAKRIPYGDAVYNEVMDFLVEEAWLLDHDQLTEWVGLLSEDVTYFFPVRQTVLRKDGYGFDPKVGHYYEDLPSIKLRVRRINDAPSAYAEDPPSRTRRHITCVRVHETAQADELFVTSSLLLTRNRWDWANYDVLSVERHDILRRAEDHLQIVRRTVLLDQVTLGTANLSVFL